MIIFIFNILLYVLKWIDFHDTEVTKAQHLLAWGFPPLKFKVIRMPAS